MKKIIPILPLMILFMVTYAYTQEDKVIYRDSREERTETARSGYVRADKRLNVVYKMLMEAYGDDKTARESLNKTQLAWIKYRDFAAHSEVAHIGNAAEAEFHKLIALEDLTDERTRRMKDTLSFLYEDAKEDPASAKLAKRILEMFQEIEKMEK